MGELEDAIDPDDTSRRHARLALSCNEFQARGSRLSLGDATVRGDHR